MLNIEETAQTQMHLLYKMGALLEWEETWWEDKKKTKNKERTKAALALFKCVQLRGSTTPDFYFFFSFLFSKLHTKKLPRRCCQKHMLIHKIFSLRRMMHICLYKCEDIMLTSSFLPSFQIDTH